MSDWSRALEVQLELIRWFRTDEVGWICGRELLTAGAGDVEGVYGDRVHDLLSHRDEKADRQIHDLAVEGRPYAEGVANILDDAVTYWVSPEMGRFLTYAQQDMPPSPFLFDEMPSQAGFVFFAEPLEFDTGHPAAHRVAALAWAVDSGWGVTFSLAPVSMHPGFWPLSCCSGPIDATPAATMDRLARAFWLLSQQRIAVNEERPMERHARRRCQRAGFAIPEDGIRVVTLRRPELPPPPEHSDAIAWSHRWIVSGHWRNQWYPASGEHRPKWIDAYPKGPDDKPLVLKDRVYRWIR